MASALPGTSGAVERRLAAGAAARLAAISVDQIRAMWDPARIPPEWLAALAWAMATDAWLPGATESERRAAVAGAIDAHRRKGTERGVRDALTTRGAVYTYTEGPNPFVASVTVHNTGELLTSREELDALVARVKRASVHITYTYRHSARLDVPVAIGARIRATRTLLLEMEPYP